MGVCRRTLAVIYTKLSDHGRWGVSKRFYDDANYSTRQQRQRSWQESNRTGRDNPCGLIAARTRTIRGCRSDKSNEEEKCR